MSPEKYKDGILEKIGTHLFGGTFGLQISVEYFGLTEGSIIGNPLYLPNEPLEIKSVRDNYLVKVEQVLGKWSYYDFYRNHNIPGYLLHERIGKILNPSIFQTLSLEPLFYKLRNSQIKQIGGGDGGRLEFVMPHNPDDRRLILYADEEEYISSQLPMRRWIYKHPFDARGALELEFITERTYGEALQYVQRTLAVLNPNIDFSFFYRDLEELKLTDQKVYQVTPKGHCFIIPQEQKKIPKIKNNGKEDKKAQDSFGGAFA